MIRHNVLTAATCIPPCQNGGTCSQPDVCECISGWTGSQCEIGMTHLMLYGIINACSIINAWL